MSSASSCSSFSAHGSQVSKISLYKWTTNTLLCAHVVYVHQTPWWVSFVQSNRDQSIYVQTNANSTRILKTPHLIWMQWNLTVRNRLELVTIIAKKRHWESRKGRGRGREQAKTSQSIVILSREWAVETCLCVCAEIGENRISLNWRPRIRSTWLKVKWIAENVCVEQWSRDEIGGIWHQMRIHKLTTIFQIHVHYSVRDARISLPTGTALSNFLSCRFLSASKI